MLDILARRDGKSERAHGAGGETYRDTRIEEAVCCAREFTAEIPLTD